MNTLRIGTTVAANNSVTVPASIGGANPTSAKLRLMDSYDSLWHEVDAALASPPSQVGDNFIYLLEGTVSASDLMPPSDNSQRYYLVWELEFDGVDPKYVTSEQVEVVGADVPQFGAKSTMVGIGGETKLIWLTPVKYESVVLRVLDENQLFKEFDPSAITYSEIQGGHKYEATFDTGIDTNVIPSLDPYLIAWSGVIGDDQDSELGQLYVVTPTMWSAATDVEAFLQRSFQTVAGQHDLVFRPSDLMTFLVLGRDYFNALYLPTNFSMTNAKGPIRNGWLMCAQVMACRSEYLAEGMKAFDFTSQNVTLAVDRTSFWESIATQLEATFDNAIRNLKTNLSRRGQTAGDGSQDALTLARRAMGAVGVTVSPVANLRGLHGSGAHWYGGWLRRTW